MISYLITKTESKRNRELTFITVQIVFPMLVVPSLTTRFASMGWMKSSKMPLVTFQLSKAQTLDLGAWSLGIPSKVTDRGAEGEAPPLDDREHFMATGVTSGASHGTTSGSAVTMAWILKAFWRWEPYRPSSSSGLPSSKLRHLMNPRLKTKKKEYLEKIKPNQKRQRNGPRFFSPFSCTWLNLVLKRVVSDNKTFKLGTWKCWRTLTHLFSDKRVG